MCIPVQVNRCFRPLCVCPHMWYYTVDIYGTWHCNPICLYTYLKSYELNKLLGQGPTGKVHMWAWRTWARAHMCLYSIGSGNWLGKMDETFSQQLQKLQKGLIHFINPFTSPSTIIEAAFHNSGGRSAAPTVVESIVVEWRYMDGSNG
jgi:hypothetical protein